MQKTKNLVIFVLIVICIYSLFSQFYLQKLGNFYTYLINPMFFIILAVIIKMLIVNNYNSNISLRKTIAMYVGITALAYMFIFLISGLFVTYGKNPYNISIKGILLNIYSTGLIIFIREYIRYKLINTVQREDKNLIFVLIVLVFTIQDLSINLIIENLNIYYIFKSIFMSVIPIIIKNSLFTYIAKYTNYMPSVLYEMIINMFLWISPILPKVPWVFTAIIDSVFPLILLYYLKYEISKKDKRHIFKMEKSVNPKGFIPFAVLVVIIIFFAMGIFPIRPIGIATGSMYPNLCVGDLAIILKCDADSVKVGDVIEYKRKDFSVIHRVKDKYIKDETIYFITRGDNNNIDDSDPVKADQLTGRVIARIPYLAYPTIWINNLRGYANVDVELGK